MRVLLRGLSVLTRYRPAVSLGRPSGGFIDSSFLLCTREREREREIAEVPEMIEFRYTLCWKELVMVKSATEGMQAGLST